MFKPFRGTFLLCYVLILTLSIDVNAQEATDDTAV